MVFWWRVLLVSVCWYFFSALCESFELLNTVNTVKKSPSNKYNIKSIGISSNSWKQEQANIGIFKNNNYLIGFSIQHNNKVEVSEPTESIFFLLFNLFFIFLFLICLLCWKDYDLTKKIKQIFRVSVREFFPAILFISVV